LLHPTIRNFTVIHISATGGEFFNHKNALGGYMALSVLALNGMFGTRSTGEKLLKVVAFLLSATLLVFSNSITSLVTAAGFVDFYRNL